MRTVNRLYRLRHRCDSQRGDTIVEVLFSMVILGIVFTTAYSLMGFGLNAEQSAIERTQLSNVLQTQAEALRTVDDESQIGATDYNPTAAGIWSNITTNYVTTTVPTNYTANTAPSYSFACTPTTGKEFTLDTTSDPVTLVAGTQRDPNIGESYWIEAFQPSAAVGGTPAADDGKYVDFDIRGCWEPEGGSATQPVEVSYVVERLLR